MYNDIPSHETALYAELLTSELYDEFHPESKLFMNYGYLNATYMGVYYNR